VISDLLSGRLRGPSLLDMPHPCNKYPLDCNGRPLNVDAERLGLKRPWTTPSEK